MDHIQIMETGIFRGMNDSEIKNALDSLTATEKNYKKGRVILHAGSPTDKMGLVLAGSVTIESNDIWGNRTILSHVEKGQFFAETYALLENETMLVDVVANENCRILFLRIGSLDRLISLNYKWASILVSNLLSISVRKNLLLSGRSFHIAPKTIRGRVMSYLNSVSIQRGALEFDIPFDRQQPLSLKNLGRCRRMVSLGFGKTTSVCLIRSHFRPIISRYSFL